MTDRENVRLEKARLRAQFHAARLALGDADYAARSALIRARLLTLPEVADAQAVHVYWPLVAKREVDTRPLIAALHARGVRVILPVVVPPSEGAAPRLRHALFEGEERLRPSRWGLLEPIGPDVDLSALDVVVVPAVGAGRNGHRIGHGAGYYDAFLAGTPAFTVCPVYAACLAPHVPAEAHDQPVDVVVTEDEVLRVSG